MRTEVKLGLFIALAGVVGFSIWKFSGTSKEKESLPFNRNALESAPKTKPAADRTASPERKLTSPTPAGGMQPNNPPAPKTTIPPPSTRTPPEAAALHPPLDGPPLGDSGRTQVPSDPQPTALGAPRPTDTSTKSTPDGTNPSHTSSDVPKGFNTPASDGQSTSGKPAHADGPPPERKPEEKPVVLPPKVEPEKPKLTPRDTELERTGSPSSPVNLPSRRDSGGSGAASPPPPPSGRGSPADGSLTASAGNTRYKIAEGDRLIDIAEDHYGDGNLWTLIKSANPGLDENHLLVGKEIVLPPKPAGKPATTGKPSDKAGSAGAKGNGPAPAAVTPGSGDRSAAKPESGTATNEARTYAVASGDFLIKIARDQLKDESRWREIFELNRDKLKTADDLREGMVLKLPGAAKPEKKSSATSKPGERRKPR